MALPAMPYDSIPGRVVHLYLSPRQYRLEGQWHWDAASVAVYASDVVAPFPQDFEGTRGVLHPDDVPALREALEAAGASSFDLRFRIITTQSTVLQLSGTGVTTAESDPGMAPPLPESEHLAQQQASEQQLEATRLRWRDFGSDLAERQSGTGSWYYHAATREAWYSDNVYRLHGLQPQSVNAHLFTFIAFAHPSDAPLVESNFDSAYRRRLPLDITYRMQTANGLERVMRICTSWRFDERGAEIMCGLLQDLTSQAALEERRAEVNDKAKSRREALRAAERLGQLGSWQLNVHTGKWTFSEQYYRLLGLQPKSVEPGVSLLLQYGHPEDREALAEACRRLEEEHVCPELEYRALRPDGQVRHFQLRGRPVLLPSGELLLQGTVRDLTLQHALERREARWRETVAFQEELFRLSERAGSASTWTWDIAHDKMEWSSGIYEMLGYKPNLLPLSRKLLGSFLHPDDRKTFNDAVETVLQLRGEVDLELRLPVKEQTRYLRAHMRMLPESARTHFVATFRDETELRALRQSLAMREQLLALLGNRLPGRMFFTDAAHSITRANNAALKWMQGRDKNVVGENLFEAFPRLKHPAFQDLLNRALKGEAATIPSLLSGEAGSMHHLVPVAEGPGTAPMVMHLLQDDAANLDTAGALLAERLADAVSERVVVLDRHMNYQVWNEACEKHYGISREDVLGHNLLEVDPGFIDEPGYVDFKRALRGDAVRVTGNGDPAQLLPVTDENGNVVAVVWVAEKEGNQS
ncbi:MAG: PAS domain-containing protein [Chitinophagaceae bacterium]|nr:MAG: PAS domain-containing protein [Chitinophagaceae bacterium]